MNSFKLLRSENIKELPDSLIRYDAELLEVAAVDLRDYLIALINALFLKASKEADLFDADTARQVLQDQKRLQSLLGVAASALGTHNLKYPNANVGQGAVFAQSDVSQPVRYPQVSSHSVELIRTIGGAGNAAWAAEIRFLGAEFRLDGERIRLADVIAARDGLVWETLHALGLQQADADRIGAVLHSRLTQPDRGAIDRLSKQVFFPMNGTDDSEDVVITPVQHLGLAREFHVRYFQRTSKENPKQERFNARALKVGGANPINAGPYNAELGGLYRHLLAEMPPRHVFADDNKAQDAQVKQLLARLRQRHTIFPRPQQLDLDVTRLLEPAMAGHQNKLNRELFAAAADGIAEILLQDAMSLSNWLARQASSPLLDEAYAKVPALQKRWLDARLRPNPRMGKDEITVLVETALQLFMDGSTRLYKTDAEGKPDKTKPLLGDGEWTLVRASLRELIEEF